MLRDIYQAHKTRIVFAYGVYAFEFTLFALLPMMLGKAIDSLILGHYWMLMVYVGISLAGGTIGFFRRRIDTRVFSLIWSEYATKAVINLLNKGVEKTRIVSRASFVGQYSSFLEYTLPSVVSSVFNICVSLFLITWAAPIAGLPVVVLVGTTLSTCYFFSNKIKKVESNLQSTRELSHTGIVNGEVDVVEKTYVEQNRLYIQRSDLDATSWGLMDLFCLITQILVVFAIVQQGHTVGTIMSTLAYTDSIFNRMFALSDGIVNWRQVEIANSLLAEE
jgi:ABC-type multidrug transport system fused ATPase/permease subunit